MGGSKMGGASSYNKMGGSITGGESTVMEQERK